MYCIVYALQGLPAAKDLYIKIILNTIVPVFKLAPDSSKHQLINSKLRDHGLEQSVTLLASLTGDLTSLIYNQQLPHAPPQKLPY